MDSMTGCPLKPGSGTASEKQPGSALERALTIDDLDIVLELHCRQAGQLQEAAAGKNCELLSRGRSLPKVQPSFSNPIGCRLCCALIGRAPARKFSDINYEYWSSLMKHTILHLCVA